MKKLGGLLLLILVGCATAEIVQPPILANRTLRISPTIPGLEYQYEVCTKYFLGICTKSQMQVDYYDLTDPVVKAQLINMGFVAKVRDKVTP